MDTRRRTLADQVEEALTEPSSAVPLVSAFRARRTAALATLPNILLWFGSQPLLGAALYPFLGYGVAMVVSMVLATVVSSILGFGSQHVLGFGRDGSVTVARVGLWGSDRIRGFEQSYPAGSPVEIEPSTPWWRSQRLMIADDQWHPAQPKTRFRRAAAEPAPI